MLSAVLRKALGAFQLDVALEVDGGSTLVLVGESGAGKTTVLRLLAGLAQPDEGRIVLDDSVYFDSERGVAAPAWTRSVGYVAQDYGLFPHLTIVDNVAFGLRAQGVEARIVRERVAAMLARFDLIGFRERHPHDLSGGQQQRVALARALVLDPHLVLLDEPLSALDLQTRRILRGELRQILAGLPGVTVYVTHNPMEAIAFGDKIAVVEAGRITQIGTAGDLLRHPRTGYVAEFMGVNLFQGRIRERDQGGLVRIGLDAGEISVIDPGGDGEVLVAVNPREIMLYATAPEGSARNVFEGIVTEIVAEPPFGERVRVAIAARPPLVAEVTQQAVAALGLREGLRVYAAFKATGTVPYR